MPAEPPAPPPAPAPPELPAPPAPPVPPAPPLPSGVPLVAHPAVGIPTAVTLHEAVRDGDPRRAIVVYDHVGLSEQWMTHLGWLGTNFNAVKWIKSRQAGWELAELEEL